MYSKIPIVINLTRFRYFTTFFKETIDLKKSLFNAYDLITYYFTIRKKNVN